MEIVGEAVKADNADELDKALALYKRSLGYFMTGLKYEKNEKTKATIREKMASYMDRAEQIYDAILEKQPRNRDAVMGKIQILHWGGRPLGAKRRGTEDTSPPKSNRSSP